MEKSIFEKRVSVRKFQQKPVEPEKIQKALKDGLLAPSHNHKREWHYLLIKDPAIKEEIYEHGMAFGKRSDEELEEMKKRPIPSDLSAAMYHYAVPLQKEMLLKSPELLIVCYKKERDIADINRLYDLNHFGSIWMVIENILLSMADQGLYGVTMIPYRTEEIKKILGIPSDYEISTFLPFGYPEEDPMLPVQIKVELQDVLHTDRW